MVIECTTSIVHYEDRADFHCTKLIFKKVMNGCFNTTLSNLKFARQKLASSGFSDITCRGKVKLE